jgi:putative flippase GtrA
MSRRLLPFALVSVLGFTLQVALTALLTRLWHWPLALSTVVAVEAAVLHNFSWHERWTWRDRKTRGATLDRCLAFHVANGLTSMVGNVVLGEMLAAIYGLDVLSRTSIAVALTGLVNFVLADRHVFTMVPGAQLILSCSPGNQGCTAGVHSERQKDIRCDGRKDLRLL